MFTQLTRLPRLVHLLVAGVLGTAIVLTGQAIQVSASAADITWVDGGDDSPCLNDDMGRALDALPSDQWCTPINGCYQDDDGKWVLPSRKTGIWQGDPSKVKYADEIKATTPTAAPTTKATTKPKSNGSSSGSTTTKKSSGSTTTGGSPTTGGTPTGDVGATTDEPVAAGAPTAPEAPVLKVDGKQITVTWQPTADAALESVTGYVLQFTGAQPVQVDATATQHVFTDLADGNYRAAVRAVNAAGESPSSPPSDIATIGTPIAEVVGTLAVDGDLEPGATVTVTGTGFAADVPELTLELHSTPTPLGTVATDANGGFTTTVTVPETVEPGEHSVVVLYEGTEITSTPVTIAEIETEEVAAVVETVPPHTGLAILVALAAAGGLALFWHVLTGRRRATRVLGVS